MHRILFKNLGVSPRAVHVHFTRLAPGQAVRLHDHDFFEVFLVLRGSGIHHLNGEELPLGRGHLVAIRPEDRHSLSALPGEGLVYVNAAMSSMLWDALCVILNFSISIEAHRQAVVGPVVARQLSAELKGLGVCADPVVVTRVWKRVCDALASSGNKIVSPPAWLEAFRREVSSSSGALCEPISYWQKRSLHSPEHLSRSCRKWYGVTQRDLINKARVERAKLLLRTTDRKVVTIAFDCGFGNMAHFHRTFARWCGMSPGRWRETGAATSPALG